MDEALIHEPRHVVLSRKLKPFCPYYRFWLASIQSPLITGRRVPQLGDLYVATWLCTRRFGEANRLAKYRGKAPAWMQLHQLWLAIRCRYHFAKESQKFFDYILDYRIEPLVDESKAGELSDHAEFPPDMMIVTGLIDAGMSREEAWMCPIGEAEWIMMGLKIHRDKENVVMTERDRLEYWRFKRIKALEELKGEENAAG